MASITLATAFAGLWVAIGAIEHISFLDQSDAMNLAQAAPLDATIQVMLPVAAIGTFDTAVTLIYVHLHNGGGGGAGNGRIPEVVTFILCASTVVLELLQPGAMDGVAQSPPLGAAVHVFLPAAATATFFLSITLIYLHARTVRGAGAGNGLLPAAVKLLTKITLAAALVTVILSLIAASLAFYTR